jgi:hypothetical protein
MRGDARAPHRCVLCKQQQQKKKNQMTRIISGRNIRFMYIYMFYLRPAETKEEEEEKKENLSAF